MSKLIDELEFWRCERPSEYKMDDFIRQVNLLEEAFDRACNELCNEGRYTFVEDLQKTIEEG